MFTARYGLGLYIENTSFVWCKTVLPSGVLFQQNVQFSAAADCLLRCPALSHSCCLPGMTTVPISVAARSKAKVYGRSPARIVGSNPTWGMDVCLL